MLRGIFTTTKSQTEYWKTRKVDWEKQYFDTWQHPHRKAIAGVLNTFPWMSLFEIGCAGGANLQAITQYFPGRQIGGIDVNYEGLKFCADKWPKGIFRLGSAIDCPMSDDSLDVILTDMTLIYVGPKDIDKAISEIKRVGRSYVVLCEFHSDSWFQRLLYRLKSGYFVYDYKKLLKKHGFYDIEAYKIGNAWPSGKGEPFRYIIKAHIVKKS